MSLEPTTSERRSQAVHAGVERDVVPGRERPRLDSHACAAACPVPLSVSLSLASVLAECCSISAGRFVIAQDIDTGLNVIKTRPAIFRIFRR